MKKPKNPPKKHEHVTLPNLAHPAKHPAPKRKGVFKRFAAWLRGVKKDIVK